MADTPDNTRKPRKPRKPTVIKPDTSLYDPWSSWDARANAAMSTIHSPC